VHSIYFRHGFVFKESPIKGRAKNWNTIPTINFGQFLWYLKIPNTITTVLRRKRIFFRCNRSVLVWWFRSYYKIAITAHNYLPHQRMHKQLLHRRRRSTWSSPSLWDELQTNLEVLNVGETFDIPPYIQSVNRPQSDTSDGRLSPRRTLDDDLQTFALRILSTWPP
jgi:hypothetical protein